ncbi:MAG: nuclear transport factor 2 family protein [Pyrinomonadaceae bacterium]|nr:nuclear transport factor 2 family protein [Pyrinomonadaceae bacterium]MBP6211724.1 nuclear transport factor 2 family protein [Pyrinomonadaceae bacterium]
MNERMKFKIVILLAIIAATSQVLLAQFSNKDDGALRSIVDRMVRAQTEYDAKTLDSILTADYIEISPVGEFDPREKVLGFYTPEAKAAATGVKATVEVTEHSIRNYGKFAVVIARLNYTMTASGKPLPPRSIRTTYVLRKDGKTWKIASAHYTGIRPQQAPKPQ